MKEIKVRENILQANENLASKLRESFQKENVKVINIIGSPGAGKTSLLEKTIQLSSEIRMAVIEGDVMTARDRDRIKTLHVPVVQIETQGGCHLDAQMIQKAITELDLRTVSILFIENVGNLVCPAAFDLGEDEKIVVISVAEGSDKPAKYPGIFERASLCILNKIDLLEYSNFSREEFYQDIRQVNPNLPVIELSSTTGTGFGDWIHWLKKLIWDASQGH